MAASLREPRDLAQVTLLHEEMAPLADFPLWATLLAAAGAANVPHDKGPRFSHTHIMLQAAIDGRGVALAQWLFAADDVAQGRLVAPFPLRLATGYAYYVVCLAGAADRPKIRAFREWVMAESLAAAATK